MRNERNGEINRKWIENAVGKYDKLYILLCKIICIKYKYKIIMQYDGHPYWELGRTDTFQGGINRKPEKLEIDLVQFINKHHETFSPEEEMKNIQRAIIRAFAMYDCPFVRSDHIKYKPGLSCIAQLILGTISDKTTKGGEINTTQGITKTLANFEVCVEFINKFLPDLCKTEEAYTQSGNGGFLGSNKWKCDQISGAVVQHWSHFYPNIFKNFQSAINRYQARVLQLWADVLIRKHKISQKERDEMNAALSEKDGYEKKMRALLAECGKGYTFTPNLDESMLLKWLTLFHVAITKDQYMTSLTKTYTDGGKASTLDGIIFGIISQFVPLYIVHGYSHTIKSKNHESKLNVLHLTCNVIEKNPPVSGPNTQQLPVMAYLSSDILDQCVESMGRFPSTDQFMQFLQSKNDAEMTPIFVPLSPTFWNQTSPKSQTSEISPKSQTSKTSPKSQTSETSETSAFNGGKKTRRKKNKKLKNVKKSKKSRRRFIKTHHHR